MSRILTPLRRPKGLWAIGAILLCLLPGARAYSQETPCRFPESHPHEHYAHQSLWHFDARASDEINRVVLLDHLAHQPIWRADPGDKKIPFELVSDLVQQPANGQDFGNREIEQEFNRLEQRLTEIVQAQHAQEDATRRIIEQSFASRGSQINDFVILGGTMEVLAGWSNDFEGQQESLIGLNTAELDFEIQMSSWSLASVIFAYEDGTDFLFPTTELDERAVDRINVDTAFFTIGDTIQTPLFGTFGRMIVPFGVSTGSPITDALTIEDPLTIEIFETREDALLVGFQYIRPAPNSVPPPPVPTTPRPLVQPAVLLPMFRGLVEGINRHIGYPPTFTPPKTTPPIAPPTPPTIQIFNAGYYLYNGNTENGGFDHIEHMGGTVGYSAQGTRFPREWPLFYTLGNPCLACHYPKPEIPWSIDIDVDINSSVFDSEFFQFEYRSFLPQIGYVPGMAAHIKTTVGPVAFIAEWNGAIAAAHFTDDVCRAVN